MYQYDHTITHLPEKHVNFHWKKIGISNGEETKEFRKLDTLMKENGHIDTNGLLLKADIEGFEWGMFDMLTVERISQFDQIVIELHDFVFASSDHKKAIIHVLEKLNQTHHAVHIHANNCEIVEYCGDLILPQLLEVTFVRNDVFLTQKTNKTFPTSIDQKNSAEMQEIMLGRWNLEDEYERSLRGEEKG